MTVASVLVVDDARDPVKLDPFGCAWPPIIVPLADVLPFRARPPIPLLSLKSCTIERKQVLEAQLLTHTVRSQVPSLLAVITRAYCRDTRWRALDSTLT